MGCIQRVNLGSPPRVRSRPGGDDDDVPEWGITSACAEQTRRTMRCPTCYGDHLRVCGADVLLVLGIVIERGSPPRVRSRLTYHCSNSITERITSACAEQTGRRGIPQAVRRDHLRVCGADPLTSHDPVWTYGSPPRVRSRRYEPPKLPSWDGITSACAEQTVGVDVFGQVNGDHLRVCGADDHTHTDHTPPQGSPPRVRSRLIQSDAKSLAQGITSACAEQTMMRSAVRAATWDHLRVCGADNRPSLNLAIIMGSPPRVRSRLRVQGRDDHVVGITSACAEQTPWFQAFQSSRWDHLRVCGADRRRIIRSGSTLGSPPRVRSRQTCER